MIATELGCRVQLDTHPIDQSRHLHGKSVGQVDLIFTLRFEDASGRSEADTENCTGAVLNRLLMVDKGRPHPVHGMIELV